MTSDALVPHLSPSEISGVLAAVGRKAVEDSGVRHPDDVASTMTAAIDAAAVTLTVLERHGTITWEPYA